MKIQQWHGTVVWLAVAISVQCAMCTVTNIDLCVGGCPRQRKVFCFCCLLLWLINRLSEVLRLQLPFYLNVVEF